MIRVETTITDEVDEKLNVLCEETGVTKREIIRRAIDSYCDQQYLLNEIMKMGRTLIDSQAVQSAKIEQNRLVVLKSVEESNKACVDATVRNYHAIQSVADRLDEIERRLGIDKFAEIMKSKAVANAACLCSLLLSSIVGIWGFGGFA